MKTKTKAVTGMTLIRDKWVNIFECEAIIHTTTIEDTVMSDSFTALL